MSSDEHSAWTSSDSRPLVKALAAAIGLLDPEEFGGEGWPIGSATDLRDILGDGGRAAINQRGRWSSDIAKVYQRAVADGQLRSSAGMADAADVDLTALGIGCN
eukprot:4281003-Pleurochrysis_carterae.AAC.1